MLAVPAGTADISRAYALPYVGVLDWLVKDAVERQLEAAAHAHMKKIAGALFNDFHR